jgi:hypothetical protein
MKVSLLKNHPVSGEDWLKRHPDMRQVSTDLYYIRLCNRLLKENVNSPIHQRLNWTDYKGLIVTLVCYFEDVITEAGIWWGFITGYKKLYGKYLPFYEISEDEYYDDEINVQDIRFLIWHFLSSLPKGNLEDPFNPFFSEIAEKTFNIFKEEFENAPQNNCLKNILLVREDETIFSIKKKLDFLFCHSYLNYLWTDRKLSTALETLYGKCRERSNTRQLLLSSGMRRLITSSVHEKLFFDTACPLLALRPGEQLANIIGEHHARHQEIKSISKSISGIFLFKSEEEKYLILEHLATGHQIRLYRETLSKEIASKIVIGTTTVWASVAQWGEGLWVASEATFISHPRTEKEKIKQEKHLFNSEEKKKAIFEAVELSFKEVNNGKRIAFFGDLPECQDFIKRLRNAHLRRFRSSKDMPNIDRNIPEISAMSSTMEKMMAFCNSRSGVEIYSGMAVVVKDPDNPYYNPEELADIKSNPILNERFSAWFVEFLLTHDKIPWGCGEDTHMSRKTAMDNLDFLLRYYKPDSYF